MQNLLHRAPRPAKPEASELLQWLRAAGSAAEPERAFESPAGPEAFDFMRLPYHGIEDGEGNMHRAFAYEGSLTRPPCTPTVHWFVAGEPIVAFSEDVFRLLSSPSLPGNSPLGNQPLSSRRERLQRVRSPAREAHFGGSVSSVSGRGWVLHGRGAEAGAPAAAAGVTLSTSALAPSGGTGPSGRRPRRPGLSWDAPPALASNATPVRTSPRLPFWFLKGGERWQRLISNGLVCAREHRGREFSIACIATEGGGAPTSQIEQSRRSTTSRSASCSR